VPPSTSVPASPREGASLGPVAAALAGPRVLLALVLVGVALRIWQWAAGTSFWLDETALARNIVALPMDELLTLPLAFHQVAPRGFLLVEKLSVLALGSSEHALRLFSFFCGLLAMVAFARLASRVLTGLAVPFAVLTFAVAVPLVRYSAEVKQFGVDALATIALLLVALHLRDHDASRRRLLAAGLAGLLLSLFSQGSTMVMAGLGLAFAWALALERDLRTARVLAFTMPVWAAAAFTAVVEGQRSMMPETRRFMSEYWAGGFAPLPPRSMADALWIPRQLLALFDDPWMLHWPLAPVFLALGVAGIATLWRRRRGVALFLVAPIAVALLAALAHQYPFRGRLLLFLLPIVLLLVAAGAEWLRLTIGRRAPALGAGVMGALLVPPALALGAARMPITVEAHREALAWLQARRQPGDVVWVLSILQSPTIFYGPRYGLGPGDWYLGACSRTDTRAFLRDVDRFRGRPRVWVMLGNHGTFRAARAALHGYLGTIGVRRDSMSIRSAIIGPELIELYDLSDPAHLASATAETYFPVDPMPTDPKPGCSDWSGDPREIVSGG
jgi:hypothetical protein